MNSSSHTFAAIKHKKNCTEIEDGLIYFFKTKMKAWGRTTDLAVFKSSLNSELKLVCREMQAEVSSVGVIFLSLNQSWCYKPNHPVQTGLVPHTRPPERQDLQEEINSPGTTGPTMVLATSKFFSNPANTQSPGTRRPHNSN